MKPECVYSLTNCPELEYSCPVHGPEHAMLKHSECEDTKADLAAQRKISDSLRKALDRAREELAKERAPRCILAGHECLKHPHAGEDCCMYSKENPWARDLRHAYERVAELEKAGDALTDCLAEDDVWMPEGNRTIDNWRRIRGANEGEK